MSDIKEKVYSYYQEKTLLPTYARFSCIEDLNRYKTQRKQFFLEKLYLPPQIFRNSNLIEFGPDSGENSLVFADWGASITLVEPNPKAWPYILDYYEKFKLKDKLVSLEKVDLEAFKTEKKFQFIVAEGFIYTIRPELTWIKLFGDILEDNGLFIISYTEVYGSFIELLHKVIYARAKKISMDGHRDVAWRLFQSKWNFLPHTRSFDSWVMDVLDNPYVRLKYFFDLQILFKQLSMAGFNLYSSWPGYTDNLNVYWHKRRLTAEQKLSSNLNFISRSCLSFALGGKIFICSSYEESIEQISGILLNLVRSIDCLIDKFDINILVECIDLLNKVREFLETETIFVDSLPAKEEVFKSLECIIKILETLKINDFNQLVLFCNTDKAFINLWGQPNHFAVFQKVS